MRDLVSGDELVSGEIIRQAMEEYRNERLRRSGSVREIEPLRLGTVKLPIDADTDIFQEMLDDVRD